MSRDAAANRKLSSTRWVLKAAVAALVLLFSAECGSRIFWRARGVPLIGAPRRIHHSFYPPLAALERWEERDGEAVEILLLGGSVVHNDYGSVAHVLRERLARATGRAVRVHNLSAAAHTSLDSFYKYRHLQNRRFDLVVVYHGINEVRANNCPRERFRADYSHLSWYRLINAYERRAGSRRLALPYTVKFVIYKLLDRMGRPGALPTHRPDPESVAHGCDVKTAGPFQENLERIVELAKRKGDPVVLMTFAFYLPDGYSEQAFHEGKLDYSAHAFPVELWGRADCVVAALEAHNQAVEEIAATNPQIGFVDQSRLMPRSAVYFNDVCHLTHEGSERLVENALPMILEKLGAGPGDGL